MAGCKKQSRSDLCSIKYGWNPIEGAAFKLVDFVHGDYPTPLSNGNKPIGKKPEPKYDKILSTTELISTVGQIWDHANRLAVFHPKVSLTENHTGSKEILGNLYKEEYGMGHLSADSKYFCVDMRSAVRSSPTVQPNLGFLTAAQKLSLFQSCTGKYTHSIFWKLLRGGDNLPYETCGGCLATIGIYYELGNIYRWMTETTPDGFKYTDGTSGIDNKTIGEHCTARDTIGCAGSFISGDIHSPASKLVAEDLNSCLIKGTGPSSHVNTKLLMNGGSTGSLLSDYFLMDALAVKKDCSVSRKQCSSLCVDYCIESVDSFSSTQENCHDQTDGDVLFENKRNEPEKFEIADEKKVEFYSPEREKPHFFFAKQEHAFAGALAGIFVSVCLHPVDTIKTVIQSCRAEEKSICYIGKSIVYERGINGLYRGIASNIASSAPISAIYTFTYESVKGALLPHIPTEFHSLAHCMAGGCASVATSFIFTPSERIKQQVQVGSQYHSCWNALIGIIGKGGLPSLYAGWGAVLCRNIPHSIIKFYTYESLKQMLLPSLHSTAHPNTLQTLVCGGLAGSTAALFTTPFDVVKTRLQTQIPGSMSQYNSVYHALEEIAKHEGLKGLYRGLIPRLVMYMSQGALFFASYEFFKKAFFSEVPELIAQKIHHKQNKDDDSVSSQSPFLLSSSESAASSVSLKTRLQSLHS
ncbi:hypothetical protein Ddye_014785 [Dipteronia dyeriana]|uniref:Mitochondrial carrier protein n=1 Tax=Dipteronia dyeriana TaxID=168575 RepID=A0AAD9WXW2_9ROSI|nr:hypothetical protein Ddye_014785 [Dipteronia dyeriana]